MRHITAVVLILLGFACLPLHAQSVDYRKVTSDDRLQDRLAYLLTLLQSDAAAHRTVAGNRDLETIGARIAKVRDGLKESCRAGSKCPLDQMELTESEVDAAADILARLAAPGGKLNALVRNQMRPSGEFQRYAALSDPDFMRAAWVATANGINRVYRVYALGEPPRYAAIDSMRIDPASQHFRDMLGAAVDADLDAAQGDLFFSTWSRMAFDLLVMNQRDNAIRYEPRMSRENASAFQKARKIGWSGFQYGAVIVPGEGLEQTETGLSPIGAFRLRIAVDRWRKGLAPFILVSGGHVHPDMSPYAEAIEMKRELLDRYGIPEPAIVIDPYARHTTTNLRNAARLLFHMGAPLDKPLLVVSDQGQINYIASKYFSDRCQNELGYQPLERLERLATLDIVGRINVSALHADLTDPLDP